QAGPYVRVEGLGIFLNVLGQTLSGDFSFEQVTKPDNTKVTRIAGNNISIGLGDGTTNFLTLTNGQGTFLITSAGLAGKLSGTITVNIPGVTLSGTLALTINNTTQAVNETFNVGGQNVTLSVQAGPFVRVEGLNVTLGIAGQSLSGDIAFEQVTKPGGAKTVKVAFNNVSLRLGDGTTDYVVVSGGQGTFLITQAGLAGKVTATLALQNIPQVSLGATVTVAINNTTVAVNENFTVGSETIALVLPAGPYLRVEATGVNLTIAGQSLSGNFAFEKATTTGANPSSVIRIAATNVSLQLGDGTTNFVSLTNGSGAFLITSAGLAGKVGGTVTLNVPGVTFKGTFSLAINNTNAAVNQSFRVGNDTIQLQLPAGPYLRVTLGGRLFDGYIAGYNGESSALRHGVARVDGQVD
ncbi:MAG: hypothetical protein AAB263_12550, partial [Planctomycetota bacterium]